MIIKNMGSRASIGPGRNGFTFIELIITLAVLGIILMMSLYVVSQMAKMSESQKNMRNATSALRAQAKLAKQTPYLELRVGRTYPFDASDIYLKFLPEGTGTVTVGDYFDVEGVKPVTLEVKWKDPKGYKSLRAVILRAPASKAEAEDEARGDPEDGGEEGP